MIAIQSIIKDGQQNLYLTGRLVNTTQSANGVVQKADDGNYYERTLEVIDDDVTIVTSNSLGTSV